MRSSIVRLLFASAVVATSLAAPAYAQDKQQKNVYQIEAEERAKEAKRIDQDYKAAMERERRSGGTAQPAANDPWSNMRGPDDSRTKR